MTYAAIAGGIDPGSIISSSQGFMSYGPLGLAGLLIVLVLTAVLLRTVDAARERVLKLVLFVGTFCFVAALIAQHFSPSDPDYSKQRDVLGNIAKALGEAAPKLQEITQMASSAGCPGGSSGIAIPRGPDMASRSSAVQATLQGAAVNIDSVIKSLPTVR